MTVPELRATRWGHQDAPLLVLGPSLGTSAGALWRKAAKLLEHRFSILAWDLPGHGASRPAAAPFSISDIVEAVLEIAGRARPGESFCYAGDSVGGCVGLQLLVDAPEAVRAAVLISTGARIGTPAGWRERAATVRASGSPVMVSHSSRVWFGPGFLERDPVAGTALLSALQDSDADSYAYVCEALAEFDVTDRLGGISTPLLAVAGTHDTATPPDSLRHIADNVPAGRYVELDGAAHLAPIEFPAKVAELITRHGDDARRVGEVRDAGMSVRRAVLGDRHVDAATAATNPLTAEFQDFITRYAWGTIWTRPGLDRRTRSLITLTALIARGHHEELAMHLRAALRNGVTLGEIREVLLQSAIYCGVPDANTAFRIANEALKDLQQ